MGLTLLILALLPIIVRCVISTVCANMFCNRKQYRLLTWFFGSPLKYVYLVFEYGEKGTLFQLFLHCEVLYLKQIT